MSETNQQPAAGADTPTDPSMQTLHPTVRPYMGQTAVDRVTGYTGTVTAFATYLTGRTDLLIERIGSDGR